MRRDPGRRKLVGPAQRRVAQGGLARRCCMLASIAYPVLFIAFPVLFIAYPVLFIAFPVLFIAYSVLSIACPVLFFMDNKTTLRWNL
ncbi:hypothetical protein AUJ68_07060 [Candidatus Woesearchaeota archaeon CG1_02_57_44]|nr:MAG: hypothetical protein AUJ68_07060 [Candidatus Woesearchaeota archaeon CG1_02_57_44]PIN68908.1 MAG: hypothetical protein COV94_03610 [Candidatus Woesearchaeota archaeon CG11_big_fil_rev_8_21_14_0_20_57_5]